MRPKDHKIQNDIRLKKKDLKRQAVKNKETREDEKIR